VTRVAVPLVFTALMCVVGWSSAGYIIESWASVRGYHAHGILMLLLVIHLLWLAKEELAQLQFQSIRSSSMLWLVACSVFWLLAWGLDYLPGEIAGFFAVWLFGICLMFGWRGVVSIGPRLGILAFSIPMWYSLTSTLQSISTFAVKQLLQIAGVTAYVEGNFVHIPTGVVEIAGGCSGISFLLASLSFVSYIAVSERMNWRGGTLYLIVAVLLSLVANWVRIFIIILCGYFYDLNHPLVGEHVLFGWVLFGVLFAPFVYSLYWGLAKYPMLTNKVETADIDHSQAASQGYRASLLIVCIIAAFSPAVQFVSAQMPVRASINSAQVIADQSYKPNTELPLSLSWRPEIEDVDFQKISSYSKGAFNFYMFSAGYFVQPEKRQLIDELSSMVPSHWQTVETKKLDQFSLIQLNADGQPVVLLRWINVGGGQAVAGRFEAKLQRLGAQLRGRNDVTISALATLCGGPDCKAEIKELTEIFRSITSDTTTQFG